MAASAPTVTVVITSRERPVDLLRALNSVFAQTRAPIEIIVVDNDSQTFDIFELMAPYGDRVRVMRNPPGHWVSRSRNSGAAAAKGDYVAFLDDDDVWKPEKLERQMASIGDALMSTCGFEYDGRMRSHEIELIYPRMLKRGNWICGATGFLCKKTLLEKVQFDETLRNAEDWDFLIRAALIAPIRYEREPLYYYTMPSTASMTGEVRLLDPAKLQIQYDVADKHRAFLGPWLYRRRIAMSTLSYLHTRKDPWRFVLHSITKAGLVATLYVLGRGFFKRGSRPHYTPAEISRMRSWAGTLPSNFFFL